MSRYLVTFVAYGLKVTERQRWRRRLRREHYLRDHRRAPEGGQQG